MQVYKNITWLNDNKNIRIKEIFGRKDHARILLSLKYIHENSIDVGVEEILDTHIIEEFYYKIYIPFIGSKINGRVHNVLERVKQGQNDGKKYYFGYLRKNGNLLGGIIFSEFFELGLKKFTSAYIGIDLTSDLLKPISAVKFLEYLFFEKSFELGFDILCGGKTPNGGGTILGSGIGVNIHKLRQKFLPYVGNNNEIIEFDESKVNDETIIFLDKNNTGKFHEAIVRTKKNIEEAKKYYEIVENKLMNVQYKILK